MIETQKESLFEIPEGWKAYGAQRVVDHVDLSLKRGEIIGLLGANGAGKSTLCKIISGLISASGGQMRLANAAYRPKSKRDAEERGVQIVQQELNLIPTMSVEENLFLSRLPRRIGFILRQELDLKAREALRRVGLGHLSPGRLTGELGVGTQQMIEIAGALDRNCELLILDEPTAALSLNETEVLFKWLKRLKEQGVCIVYVSHRLDEILELTDRIAILRDGKLVQSGMTKDHSTDEMVHWMTGEDQQPAGPSVGCHAECTKPLMRVRGFTRQPKFHDVDFDLSSGEVLGIAGLVGSGRTELLRSLYGADQADCGTVWCRDRQSTQPFRSPRAAAQQGLAMVTENRKTEGLLMNHPIRPNVSLGQMGKLSWIGGLIRRRKEAKVVETSIRKMAVRHESIEQDVQTLSGGNQQKVVIARWLGGDRRIYLVDEPTRGVDVGSRKKIYEVFSELAKAGKAVLMVSSDLDELLEVCDRILVMSAGTLAGEFHRSSWTREAIMEACFSGYRNSSNQAELSTKTR
ncbi:MAG: sugar ABC transporter ATP-binding protein [Planctomycetota bacterium]|nr:sugar ABC transporter ATP-binding protein [Planctomycetota bacterium]